MGHQRDYSEQVAAVVDEEVRALIEQAHDEAWHVVNDNRDILDRLVLELLEKETLNRPSSPRSSRTSSSARSARLAVERAPHRSPTCPPVLTPAEQAAMNGHSNGFGAPVGSTETAG